MTAVHLRRLLWCEGIARTRIQWASKPQKPSRVRKCCQETTPHWPKQVVVRARWAMWQWGVERKEHTQETISKNGQYLATGLVWGRRAKKKRSKSWIQESLERSRSYSDDKPGEKKVWGLMEWRTMLGAAELTDFFCWESRDLLADPGSKVSGDWWGRKWW